MARLTGSSAVLLVADIGRSAAYYRDRLGFTCEVYGDPPDFLVATRDDAIVLMALCEDPDRIVPNWQIVDKGLERLHSRRRRRGDLCRVPTSRRTDRLHAL